MGFPKSSASLRRARGPIAASPARPIDRLANLPSAFDNPGQLHGRYYLRKGIAKGAPLVVVLHGCTQTAAVYDHGSGWSHLADRHGFALLFPEQTRSNNMNLCFNWYQPGDAARGRGEAASIRAMVGHMVMTFDLDPTRVFITGLSAGGAMTSVMLATYPEAFSAGAVIAGLPYGCAQDLSEALSAMSSPRAARGSDLGTTVRSASSYRGPWPRVSVWHGSADRLVVPGNADAIVGQWRDLHALPDSPTTDKSAKGYRHRAWAAASGEVLVEDYLIAGMAHGTPLKPGREEGESGHAGPHMLDVGLSSTDRIAEFFGIAPQSNSTTTAAAAADRVSEPTTPPANDVQAVIERALRSAGLLR